MKVSFAPSIEVPSLFVMMIRGIFLFSVGLYIAGGLVYLLFRLTIGERFVVVTLGNIFLHWFLLLSVLLLPVALLLRTWWVSGILSVFVVAFVALYGAMFLPRASSAHATTGAPLRVVTYNTATSYTHPNDLAYFLDETNADIVALVELSTLNAARLARDFADQYPYHIFAAEGVAGKGLLSRYPIIASQTFYMETDRPNIHAVLRVGTSDVHVYVVHPPSPNFNRALNFYVPNPANRAEVEHLMAQAAVDTPTLLLGDFNFTDQSASYRYIRQHGYQDTFREVGFGFGTTFRQRYFPLGRGRHALLWRDPPIARIDYIWHSPHFTPLSAHVGGKGHSDHVAVIANLHLR